MKYCIMLTPQQVSTLVLLIKSATIAHQNNEGEERKMWNLLHKNIFNQMRDQDKLKKIVKALTFQPNE